MHELTQYEKLGTQFVQTTIDSNPTQKGYARKILVLYLIARFGFSNKLVAQFTLKIPREAINKLFRKLMVDGLINERKSFGSIEKSVYYLSAKGSRYISFETQMEFNKKTDTSAHNSKTEIHDLSIQICIIDKLLASAEYCAFVTEKELRELGYGTWGPLKKERVVDGLLYYKNSRGSQKSTKNGMTGQWHAIEMECSNSKNKKTAQHNVREDILNKYLSQLEDPKGLYTRILFFSHRERFLRQIKTRIDQIRDENKTNYSDKQQELINTQLKYVNSFCPTLYNLFWNMEFKLDTATHIKVEIQKINLLLSNLIVNKTLSQEFKDGYQQAIKDIDIKAK